MYSLTSGKSINAVNNTTLTDIRTNRAATPSKQINIPAFPFPDPLDEITANQQSETSQFSSDKIVRKATVQQLDIPTFQRSKTATAFGSSISATRSAFSGPFPSDNYNSFSKAPINNANESVAAKLRRRVERFRKLVSQTINEERLYGYNCVRFYGDDADTGNNGRNGESEQYQASSSNAEYEGYARRSRTLGFLSNSMPLGASAATISSNQQTQNSSGNSNVIQKTTAISRNRSGSANKTPNSLTKGQSAKPQNEDDKPTKLDSQPVKKEKSFYHRIGRLSTNRKTPSKIEYQKGFEHSESAEKLEDKQASEKLPFNRSNTISSMGYNSKDYEDDDVMPVSVPITVTTPSKPMQISGHTVRISPYGNNSTAADGNNSNKASNQSQETIIQSVALKSSIDPLIRLSGPRSTSHSNYLSERSSKAWPFRLRRLMAPSPFPVPSSGQSSSVQQTGDLAASSWNNGNKTSETLLVKGGEYSVCNKPPISKQNQEWNEVHGVDWSNKRSNHSQSALSKVPKSATIPSETKCEVRNNTVHSQSDEMPSSLANNKMSRSNRQASAVRQSNPQNSVPFSISATVKTKESSTENRTGGPTVTNNQNVTSPISVNEAENKEQTAKSAAESQTEQSSKRKPKLVRRQSLNSALNRSRTPIAVSSVVVWSSSDFSRFLVSGDISVTPNE